MNYKIPIDKVDSLAKGVGFKRIAFQENIGMVSYQSKERDMRLNFYLTKSTLIINWDGKNISNKNCSYERLKEIFNYASELSQGTIN